MENVKLSPRLKAVASFVPYGCVPADVGTDHGYLPISLIKSGWIKRAVASDIKEGPLCSAKLTAKRYEVEDRIDFVLTDGLHGTEDRKYDTAVMAGMGGETIVKIISEAPFLKQKVSCLILQPQSKIEVLRGYLSGNGWSTEDECLVRDSGRLYDVIKLVFTGEGEVFSPAELYTGRKLFENRSPLLAEYVEELTEKFEKQRSGLEMAESTDETSMENVRAVLNGLRNMREEITW